jgi:hypothetical protein
LIFVLFTHSTSTIKPPLHLYLYSPQAEAIDKRRRFGQRQQQPKITETTQQSFAVANLDQNERKTSYQFLTDYTLIQHIKLYARSSTDGSA